MAGKKDSWLRFQTAPTDRKFDSAAGGGVAPGVGGFNPTARGEYHGHDDSGKNMPLPAGRNTLAAREILRLAKPEKMAGFSSDLTILQANSLARPHDGHQNSFYETLKRGEGYRGYYGQSLAEVTAIYRALRDGKPINLPATMPTSTQATR